MVIVQNITTRAQVIDYNGNLFRLATWEPYPPSDQVNNIAFNEYTSLNELYRLIRERVAGTFPAAGETQPVHRDFRAGDVRHSLADIGKAKKLLGSSPEYSVRAGLDKSTVRYINKYKFN